MATKITMDERSEEITLPDPVKLEWLQSLVGGYIEFVNFPDGSALMVHEEGRLIGLPVNHAATSLCVLKGKRQPEEYPIVGTAVFFSRVEMEKMEDDENEDDDTGERHEDDPLDPYTHDRVGDSSGDDDGC
jgi:hypothetical protein